MSTLVTFPYEGIAQNDETGLVPDSSVTSISVKSHALYYAVCALPETQSKDKQNKAVAVVIDGLDESVEASQSTVLNRASFSALKFKPIVTHRFVSTLLTVSPSSFEQNLGHSPVPTIPPSSPIYPLRSLQTGWDGYWAAPLSQHVLLRAHELWLRIKQITLNENELPRVNPAANGSVTFTWSDQYPTKELEIWLYDRSDYYAEWMLSTDEEDEEGTSQTQAELMNIVRQYQEL